MMVREDRKEMSIIRVNKTNDYTVMSNYHFREKEMSLRAKGLLSEMLSLPEDWDYSIAGLASINSESEEVIKKILDELKQFGYLEVKKLLPNQTKTGRIEYVYDIYEEPQKQEIEKQPPEKQPLVNPPQYNTNNKIRNNKIKNNNNIVEEVLDYLNKKTDQHYKSSTPKTRTLINARVNEGFILEDFKKVIDNKTADWQYTDMERYLRPETLFGTKFEGYLNQKLQQNEPEWFGKQVSKSNTSLDELEEILKDF